jgi:TetR/AcrR family fatty acid metabolism transcriptional regulator
MRTKEGNKEAAILEAAIKVFAKEGYHQAKISKIAEEAGVAAGSIYLYFRDKEDILLKIFDHLWGTVYRDYKGFLEQSEMNSIDKIEALLEMMFSILTANPSLAVVMIHEQDQLLKSNGKGFTKYYRQLMELSEQIIREGCRKGEIKSDLDPSITRHFIYGGARQLVHFWADGQKEMSLEMIRRNIGYLTKYGMLPQ